MLWQFGQNLTNVKPHSLQLTEPSLVSEPHLGHLNISFNLHFGQLVSSLDTLVLHFGQIKFINPVTFVTLYRNYNTKLINKLTPHVNFVNFCSF